MPRLREFRWDSWADWAVREIERDKPPILAVDTETKGLGYYDEPFSGQLTWRSREGAMRSAWFEIDTEGPGWERRAHLLSVALESVPAWVFHNAKFDLQKLMLMGIIDWPLLERIELHDTQSAYVLLDENSTKRLKDLAVRLLGYEDTIAVEIKSGPNKGKLKQHPKEEYILRRERTKLGLRKEDGYHLLPRHVVIPYGLKDTEFTLGLHELLQPRLRELGDPRILELYAESMERKLALLDMESHGFALDLPYLERTASEYGSKVMEGWQKIVQLTGKPDFNPGSWQQVQAVFADRGHRLESTRKNVLEALDDELARVLLQYRSDKKTHTSYLVALLNEQRKGVWHPNFNDDQARTGRMSSSSAKE